MISLLVHCRKALEGQLAPLGGLRSKVLRPRSQNCERQMQESTLGLWNQNLLLILLGKVPALLLSPLCMGVRPCIRAGNRNKRTMNSPLLCVEDGITGPRELLEWLYLHPASFRLPAL